MNIKEYIKEEIMPETGVNIEQTVNTNSSEYSGRAQHIVDAKASRIKKPGVIRSALAAGTLFLAAACNSSIPSNSEALRFSQEPATKPIASEVIVKPQRPETTPSSTPEATQRPLFQKLNIEELMNVLELGDEKDIAGDLSGGSADKEVEKATQEENRQLLSFSQDVLNLKGISYEDQFTDTSWTLKFPNEKTPAYTENDYLIVAESNELKGSFSSIKTIGLYNDTAINSDDSKDFGLRQRLIIVKPKETFDTKGFSASTNPDEISPIDTRFQEYLKGLLKIPAGAKMPKFGNQDKPFDAEYYSGSFDLNGRQVGFAYQPEDGTIYISDQATYETK